MNDTNPNVETNNTNVGNVTVDNSVGNPQVQSQTQPQSPIQPQVQPQIQPLPTNVTNPVNVSTVSPTIQNASVSPSPSSVGGNQTDPGAVVNENLKKVEINYTPPSKFKIFLLIVFFILLLAFVIFLPEITEYMRKMQSGELNQGTEKITTGTLTCTLENHTTNLDKEYEVVFSFAVSKLEKMRITTITRGDITLDEATLDELNNTCTQLSKNVKKLKGIGVTCDYANGKLIETQNFELANVDADQLNAAFTEAGGTVPNYTYGQDIDSIEKNMNASNYQCSRTK